MSASGESVDNQFVIAVPVANGRLCTHFGQCKTFALMNVDKASKKVCDFRELDPPAHQPGVLPRWLADQGANLVISGSMGQRALDIFADHGIDVVSGAPPEPPEKVVRSYLDGQLTLGANTCDH